PKHGMIQPAAVASLRGAGDALEAEAEPLDDAERRVVVRRRGDPDPMQADAAEAAVHGRACRLRHDPAANGVLREPVAELAALVRMHEHLQTDHAEQASAPSLTDREAERAPLVPVAHAGLRED